MTESITLSSFNCRGLGDGRKRRSVFQWLKKYHNSIILLQETHSTISTERSWEKEWGCDIYFSHGTSGSRGVAILFPKQLIYTIKNQLSDEEGRLLILDVEMDTFNFVILNIYAPTKDHENEQLKFLDTMCIHLHEFGDKNVMIGGDFNVCLNPDIDKQGGTIEDKSRYALTLEHIMEEFNLGDVWRITNPSAKKFTRRAHTRGGFVQSRIDYWLVSIHMIYNLKYSYIKPGIKSDHSLINVTFTIKTPYKRGRGFWKLNTSLLRDNEYIERIKTCLGDCNDKYKETENKSLVWDTIKCEIRSISISYATYKAKELNKTEKTLLNRIEILENYLSQGQLEFVDELNSTKREFEDIQNEKSKGIMIRSRANLVECNEKCTKYFLNLEKEIKKQKTSRLS